MIKQNMVSEAIDLAREVRPWTETRLRRAVLDLLLLVQHWATPGAKHEAAFELLGRQRHTLPPRKRVVARRAGELFVRLLLEHGVAEGRIRRCADPDFYDLPER